MNNDEKLTKLHKRANRARLLADDMAPLRAIEALAAVVGKRGLRPAVSRMAAREAARLAHLTIRRKARAEYLSELLHEEEARVWEETHDENGEDIAAE